MNKKILAVYDMLLDIKIDNLESKLYKESENKKQLKKLITKRIK